MNRLFSRLALIAALAFVTLPALSGCDLTELNDNPNRPSQANPVYLFTNAQGSLAGIYWAATPLGRFTNLYAQYWSQTQYVQESRYEFPDVRNGANSAMWNTYYLAMSDLEQIVRIAREDPERASLYGAPTDQVAMARILQVWTFQTLTDLYGQTALSAGDVLFSGDTGLWQAFGNGLKMRLAIRMADAAPGAAREAFVKAYQATSFTDLSGYQQALFPFGTSSSPFSNPIYANQVEGGRDDWGVSAPLLSVMNAIQDPRRPAYAQPSEETSAFVGFPYGLRSGPANNIYATNNFSRPSERVAYTATAPAILYTEAEELFMLAEAAERGWISGSPEPYYRDAIRASLAYWDKKSKSADITEAEATAYLHRVPYDNANGWAPTGDQATWKQTLGIQKWIAFYMQGLQGWSVFRRLDFDGVFVVPPDDPGNTLFGKHFPVRLPYPAEEPALNGKNYTQAVEKHLGGVDDQGAPLWWDGQAAGEPKGE